MKKDLAIEEIFFRYLKTCWILPPRSSGKNEKMRDEFLRIIIREDKLRDILFNGVAYHNMKLDICEVK